jgi:hypothetical protein
MPLSAITKRSWKLRTVSHTGAQLVMGCVMPPRQK